MTLTTTTSSALTGATGAARSGEAFRPREASGTAEASWSREAARGAGQGVEAAEAFHLAAVPLGGAAGATVAEAGRGHGLAGRGRRGVVDVALDGHGGADPLADQAFDDHHPFPALVPQTHLVADAQGVGGLHPLAVHMHVAAPAGGGAEGTRLDQAYGPDPAVDPDRFAGRRSRCLGGGHRGGDLGIEGSGGRCSGA
ncbi:hypothetical protein BIV23_22505 [Streptomyces monashensis]|uniref:Uncharacterized protein n=1 Tax=Streptomyces monashensis TaxID=1678012 RepID=A0A1S2QAP3_9ACTN|nr:hypothetical protein BIV23_22505 [Streptomyces monashensis]